MRVNRPRSLVDQGVTFNLVDVPTLAARLGVRAQFVRRLVDQRRIPFVKIGRLVRFDLAEIDGWLAVQRVEPVTAHVNPAPRRRDGRSRDLTADVR